MSKPKGARGRYRTTGRKEDEARDGDARATTQVTEAADFDELYGNWKPFVESVARRYVNSDDEAEDAAHVVFLRLWCSGRWKQIRSRRKYFRAAARGVAWEFLRNRRREVPLDQHAPGLMDRTPTPEQRLAAKRRRRLLAQILGHLSWRCERVMRLRFLDGLSNGEVAEELGVKRKAVEKQVTRAYAKLRANRSLRDFREWVSFFEDGGG